VYAPSGLSPATAPNSSQVFRDWCAVCLSQWFAASCCSIKAAEAAPSVGHSVGVKLDAASAEASPESLKVSHHAPKWCATPRLGTVLLPRVARAAPRPTPHATYLFPRGYRFQMLKDIDAQWPEALEEILLALSLTWEQAEMIILNARVKLEAP